MNIHRKHIVVILVVFVVVVAMLLIESNQKRGFGYISTLATTSDGALLVGNSAGLYCYKDGDWTITDRHTLPTSYVSAITVTDKDVVWVGCASIRGVGGIAYSSNGKWHRSGSTYAPYSDDHVEALHITDSGSVWVGTEYGDIVKITDNVIVNYSDKWKEHNVKNVRAITETSDGTIWIGCGVWPDKGKLFAYKNDKLTRMTLPNRLGQAIWCMITSNDGSLWIGTNSGVGVFSNGQWTVYNSKNNNIGGDDVLTMYQTKLGTVWIGTDVGLSSYGDGKWQKHDLKLDGTENLTISAITQTNDDTLWIGFHEGKLAKYVQGELSFVEPK